jgi:hypothetical protein
MEGTFLIHQWPDLRVYERGILSGMARQALSFLLSNYGKIYRLFAES